MPRNVWNYKLYGHCMVQHHLLELLLWPNADGSFRKKGECLDANNV